MSGTPATQRMLSKSLMSGEGRAGNSPAVEE
jgi:hypothetical protein